jgi:hypothetical protein
MGLEALITALISLPHTMAGLVDAFSGAGAVTVLYATVGLLLWWVAGKLATRMVAGSSGPITGDPLTQRGAMAVACAAVGMLVFVNVAGATIYDIMSASRSYYLGSTRSSVSMPRAASEVVELSLALWFIFGSRGIAAIILWVRTAGDKSQSPVRRCSRCAYILHDEATRCSECGADAPLPVRPAE